jgi:hypothetical protein
MSDIYHTELGHERSIVLGETIVFLKVLDHDPAEEDGGGAA